MEYDQQTLLHLRQVQMEILKEFIRVCEENNIRYFVMYGSAIGAERHHGYIPWDDDLDVGLLREDYEKFLQVADQVGDAYEVITPLLCPEYSNTVTHLQKKGTLFLSEDDRDCVVKKGINIDLFVLDPVSDDESLAARQYRRSWVLGRLIFLTGKGKPHLPFGGIKAGLCRVIFKITHGLLYLFRVTPQKLYRKLEKISRRCEGQTTEYLASFACPMAKKESFKREWLFPLKTVPFENMSVKVPCRDDLVLTKQYGDYMQLPPVEDRVTHRPAVIDFGEE